MSDDAGSLRKEVLTEISDMRNSVEHVLDHIKTTLSSATYNLRHAMRNIDVDVETIEDVINSLTDLRHRLN